MERFLLIGGTGHLGYAIVNEINNLREKKINITILSRNEHLPIHFPKNNQLDFVRYNPEDINQINFRAEGFPEELVDNEPENRGYEI